MQRMFTMTLYIQGTLAANHALNFAPPVSCQLVGVSVCNSSANAGKIDIGTHTDPDAYLDNKDFGVSSVPVQYDWNDFVDSQFPHIAAGTNVEITITDHASHMAAAAVVLTFTEG